MLSSKVALVTGSTMGIGFAVARALASKGASITMTDLPGIDDEHVLECRESLESEFSVSTSFIPADLSIQSEVRQLAKRTIETHPSGPDILVNNAGFVHKCHVEDLPDDVWDRFLAVMMTAPFLLTKAVLPGMRSKGWGRIININSCHGLVGTELRSGYSTAKHGLMGLTKSVAMDVAGTGVTVNSINPGVVYTRIYEKSIKRHMEEKGITREEAEMEVFSRQPIKKYTTVEQIGEAALFFCSPSADVITGAHLSIDGGWTAT